MRKCNRLRSAKPSRQKAFFGSEEAATLAAAGIGAAASLAAAGISAAAQNKAAKDQAKATEKAAQLQSDALARQNENANKAQEKYIEFSKQQNEKARQIQTDYQMQLQMLTGQQNENERLEAAKIQVRNGGRKRKCTLGTSQSFLRGRNSQNLPFTVIDGGGVIPIMKTPEGYDLYEIYGNDHEHYHKAQGGKNKTGVGIKFADGQVIEGEGNQNSNNGELLLVTPNDAKFISKHSIKGFNPAKAVYAGMNPSVAFEEQELLKNMYNISDDGKGNNTTPVERMYVMSLGGGLPYNYSNPSAIDVEYTGGLPISIAANYNMINNQMKCGGRKHLKCGGRKKAPYGWGSGIEYYNPKFDFNKKYYGYDLSNPSISSPSNMNTTSTSTRSTSKSNFWNNGGYNIVGAGLTSFGNLGGALITNIGNNRASRYITAANNRAGNIMANAYNNLRTIDENIINRDDYRAAHAMAQIRVPYVNYNPELTQVERSRQRVLSNIGRNSLSSAAAMDRYNTAEVNSYDMRSKIYGQQEREKEAIAQGNVERISQTANENANRDTNAIKDYTQSRLALMQYNNDIINDRILGSAQAKSDAITQNASVIGSTRQANATSWAGAINQSFNNFGNAFATNGKMQNELDMSRYGLTSENNLMYTIQNHDLNTAKTLYRLYKNNNNYKGWADLLYEEFGDKLNS